MAASLSRSLPRTAGSSTKKDDEPTPSPPSPPPAFTSTTASVAPTASILEFQDISYTVLLKKIFRPESKCSKKSILTNVSGFAKAGELTAIMGASGCGKTTLLDILADRISGANITGSFMLDGVPVRRDVVRRMSAYVMQNDLMFAALTVRETIMYAAELRLPSSVTKKQKAAKVEGLIDLLGLRRVADSKIGDETVRGVSGGERKRVAIGVEMIGDPKVLFLDEPTSGLDSTNTYRVVQVIKNIAEKTSSIVIMVLHQPSFRVLDSLDRLLLLAAGRTVFFAAPSQIPEYFTEFGFSPPAFANPTEFALDVIQELLLQDEERDQEQEENKGRGVDEEKGREAECEEGKLRGPRGITRLVEFYAQWSSSSSRKSSRDSAEDDDRSEQMSLASSSPTSSHSEWESPAPAVPSTTAAAKEGLVPVEAREAKETKGVLKEGQYANGWFRELLVLCSRSMRVIRRTPALYLLRLLLIMVTGLLIASLFWRPAYDSQGLHERLAFISFLSCTLFFSAADATPLFIQERNIFIRETSHHAYRPSTYMVSSTLVYLPLQALMALAITFESWWCVNLAGGGSSFAFVVLVCFACLFTGNAFATFVSAAVNNVILAYAIVISLMANFALVCGFYIQRASIPPLWIWLHYLSPVKYAYEALTLNEFNRPSDICYQPAAGIFSTTPLAPLLTPSDVQRSLTALHPPLAASPFANITTSSCLLHGPELVTFSLGLTELNKWECVAVLFAIGFGLRLVHFALLVRLSKHRRS